MPLGSGPRVPQGGDNVSHQAHAPKDQRQSAFDAVGQGFLAFYADDDDDDDDDPRNKPAQANQSSQNSQQHDNPFSNAHRVRPTPPPANIQPVQAPPPRLRPQQQPQQPPRQIHDHHHPPPNAVTAMPHMSQPVPRPPPATFINNGPRSPQMPPTPMSPHPLLPPKVPIAPAFVVPKNSPRISMVKFAPAILRGNNEETLLSKATPRGADFWKRFSVVVKEESRPDMKKRSSWLVKHHSTTSRMRGCIWGITLVILIALGGAITMVYFLTRDAPAMRPQSLGGSANAAADGPTTLKASSSSSRSLHYVTGGLPPSTTPIPTIGLPTTDGPGAVTAAHRRRNTYPVPAPTANPVLRRHFRDRAIHQ